MRQTNPSVIGATSEVNERVKHERSGEDPVNVAGEVELTAVAAGVVAVASSHGEVGKGSDEADKSFSHRRAGKEGRETEVHVGVVAPEVIAKGSVNEGPGRKEENDESNPQADAARAGHVQGASVEGATRLVYSYRSETLLLEFAVAALLLAAVGLLCGVRRLGVGGNGVRRSSVLHAGDAAALSHGEEGGVARALVDAALRGGDVGRSGSSFVRRSRVGHRRGAVGLLGRSFVATLVRTLGALVRTLGALGLVGAGIILSFGGLCGSRDGE